ncbi:unnamed protein product, partial [Timema podura]|nr:unnamed protein product [Timema podura]
MGSGGERGGEMRDVYHYFDRLRGIVVSAPGDEVRGRGSCPSYLSLEELFPVRSEIEEDPVGGSRKSHSSHEQNHKHHVREQRREVDHLKYVTIA